MNKKDDKNNVKYAQLDLLNELKRICSENNISYFLNGGSLLGAIRHNGFIPWDDDIDVGMLRNDYDKFVECCKKELNNEYYLHNWDTDESAIQPFSKLKIKGTHYSEEILKDSNVDDGIFIDIFPYDNVPNNLFLQKIQAIKILIYRKSLLIKGNVNIIGNSFQRKVLYLPIKIYSIIHNKNSIKKKMIREMLKYDKKATTKVTTHGGSYSYFREMIDLSWINKKSTHKFEMFNYDIPSNYDAFLTHLYGDYMKLPPKSKREGKHKIINVDFGEYKIKASEQSGIIK